MKTFTSVVVCLLLGAVTGHAEPGDGESSRRGPPPDGPAACEGAHEDGERGDGERRRKGPPPEALTACEGAAAEDSCSFEHRDRTVDGNCREVRSGDLACVPEHHKRRRRR